MSISLADFENRTRDAVCTFWSTRTAAKEKQKLSGKSDQGERAGVTAGKNMDGFIDLILKLIETNGLGHADIHMQRKVLTLPGFFRPTKLWDLLVTYKGELIAGIELKSQVGPSFGNNFNNRTEEAIGTGHDFWTAYREGAFGEQPRPFVGWLMLVEDADASRSPVTNSAPHFPVFPEFDNASYLERYDLLCQKLMKEQLYSVASLITSKKSAHQSGEYESLSDMTSIKTFVTKFAGHIAAEAARLS